ncbi:MAG: hypothetical protein ACI3W8_06790 [Oscillospiraceae bacterium]
METVEKSSRRKEKTVAEIWGGERKKETERAKRERKQGKSGGMGVFRGKHLILR